MIEDVKTRTAYLEINTDSFLGIISRAINTLEPEYWPEWVKTLDAEVKATDKLTLAIKRESSPEPTPEPSNEA